MPQPPNGTTGRAAPADGGRLGGAGLHHVGIAVTNLDAAVAWWTEQFGLRLAATEADTEQGVIEAMLRAPSPGGARSGRGTGGDPRAVTDPDAAGQPPAVQLLAPLGDDSPVARFLGRHGPGLHHVAFAVEDVEAFAETLRARGVPVLYERARLGTGGSRINFVHPRDTGGVLVELVEPPAGPPTGQPAS